MSSPRLRRLRSDRTKVLEEFSGHPHITVIPEPGEYPEKYDVIYRLPGLRMENQPVEQHEHRVTFYLGRTYPQMKPKCEIHTPIFHPNFRGGVVCIGDHWTAGGETLVDLIVKVGDMIQYKEYNVKSPMDATSARWAVENAHSLPIANIPLYKKDLAGSTKVIEDDWGIEIGDVNMKPAEDLDFDIEFGD